VEANSGFLFDSHNTKGETLVIFLMEVFDACYNVGLVVVAIVFDMGASNVKAL
jgi:hypothetical protein